MTVYLFGNGTQQLGIIAPSVIVAAAYLRHMGYVVRYIGIDTRSPEQRWNSGDLGVVVPDGWRPLRALGQEAGR